MRRLRLLRDLALLGTVAAVAQARHLTGPAVSQQLAALEKEAGVALLAKHGRTLRLTRAGELMVEHAEVILGGLAAAEADLNTLRAGGRGLVRIAAFPSAARVLLPELWRALEDEGVDLRIGEAEPPAGLDALRRGEADVAVVHAYSLVPREIPPGCEQHRLLDEPVLFALAPALAQARGLAAGAEVELADFADHDWLLPDPDTSCHELARRACGAAGFVPRTVALARDFGVLTALVGAEAGVALVPAMALPHGLDDPRLRLHPVRRPLVRTVSAVTATGDARQVHLRRVLDRLHSVSAATEAALMWAKSHTEGEIPP